MVIDYPWSISAIDTEGQFMNIARRMNATHRNGGEISDNDSCKVISGRNDPHDPKDVQKGEVKWKDAFKAIADFMNATTLDVD
jgi:hypothetical protein